jgi:hypothetical protein
MKIILNTTEENIAEDWDYNYLKRESEYTVYGMIIKKSHILYYLCDEIYIDFPSTHPFNIFKVIDGRLSRYWIFGLVKDTEQSMELMFPEWVNEDKFANNLVDGEEREVQIFKAYKEAMDLEFPDSSISEIAQVGDNEWLICPICIDAWMNRDNKDALVKCPKCLKILNNPRYINEYPHL